MRIDRIMRTEEKPDAIVIETTDVHLPHAIREALHDAFQRQPAVSISGGKPRSTILWLPIDGARDLSRTFCWPCRGCLSKKWAISGKQCVEHDSEIRNNLKKGKE
jgi:hypothetical protein